MLAPIALEAGSLRLHDIVETQQAGFTPLGWLAAESGLAADVLRWINRGAGVIIGAFGLVAIISVFR